MKGDAPLLIFNGKTPADLGAAPVQYLDQSYVVLQDLTLISEAVFRLPRLISTGPNRDGRVMLACYEIRSRHFICNIRLSPDEVRSETLIGPDRRRRQTSQDDPNMTLMTPVVSLRPGRRRSRSGFVLSQNLLTAFSEELHPHAMQG